MMLFQWLVSGFPVLVAGADPGLDGGGRRRGAVWGGGGFGR